MHHFLIESAIIKEQVNTAIVGSAVNSAMEEGGGADGTDVELDR